MTLKELKSGEHYCITEWFLTMTENGLNPIFLSDSTEPIFSQFISTNKCSFKWKLHTKLETR
jgi:hypothetical protein